jgi:uncharacterized repeat protein (TIGR03833 family)
MTTLMYTTGGRHYKIKKEKKKKGKKTTAKVSRISCEEYDKSKTKGNLQPKVGDKVVIIVKPYRDFNCITGIVKDVLTKKAYHSQGKKLRLTTGDIGRIVKILK